MENLKKHKALYFIFSDIKYFYIELKFLSEIDR